MRSSLIIVALVVLSVSLALASSSPRVSVKAVKHILRSAPHDWELVGPADPQHEMKVMFALKQRNLDQLETLFWEVSDPQNAKYGSYLTLDQVAALTQPEESSIKAVMAHLRAFNPSKLSLVRSRDFIEATLSVSSIESIFATTVHVFSHKTQRRTHISALGDYSLPVEIAAHVDYVTGVNGFPNVETAPISVKASEKRGAGDIAITPALIRARYNVSQQAVGFNVNSTQAVAEFQYQYFSANDLSLFYKSYVPNSKNSAVFKTVGQNDQSEPGVEASLDIQFIKGVAPEADTWFYSVPSMDFWSDLTTWIGLLNNDTATPWVHSISYGDQVAYTDPWSAYQDRFNVEMQKLAVRGISIIFASGDSGTGCTGCIWFSPSFPATSPYVTCVGATEFTDSSMTEEMAVSQFGSGGGFAWDFKMPSYQQSLVPQYFKNAPSLPESTYFSATGRGTPDVAALGWNFQVFVSGAVEGVGGTSASAPTFAGIVTLLNDIRFGNNKKPLGFLNPFLYQMAAANPTAFYDVTQGNNQDGCCGYTGFVAAPGWDPVTGLGTPNYAVLAKIVANLP